MTDHTSKNMTAGKVLIVDDSATARRQHREAFEKVGFQVFEASEGIEALWRCREQSFDSVLVDVHMPTMDGLELLRELRKLPNYANTPVYIVTSDYTKERMAKGRELGATAWVVKPTDLNKLANLVRQSVADSKIPRSRA